jgi:acyl carrier protein
LHHQINGASHFSNDLGLDSLDTVEVVMAIEEVRAHIVSLGKGLSQKITKYLTTTSTGVQP